MPKASFYDHDEDLEKFASQDFEEWFFWVLGEPDPMEKFADLDFGSEYGDVEFLDALEEFLSIEIDKSAMLHLLSEDICVHDVPEFIEKNARKSTAQEKARAKQYRMRNKHEISRKAKIRRRKIKSGQHIQKARVGSAAGGYSFVMKPQGKKAVSTSSTRSSTGGTSVGIDFDPGKNIGTTARPTKLKPL